MLRKFMPAVMGGGAAFSPTQITGLQLWLKADAITGLNDGDAITTWSDQSNNGNDATQSTADNKPTYQTNEQNGKPIVRFDGSNDVMSLDSAIALTDFTVYIAYKATVLTAGLAYILGGTGEGFYAGGVVAGFNGYGIYTAAATREANVEPTTFGIVTFQNSYLARNGAEATYDNTGTIADIGVSKIAQRGDDASLDFGGDIAEILIYNTVHSAATRYQVEKYLGDRWGVAINP